MSLGPTTTLSYVGNGPSAGGQVINSGLGGPLSKTLIGYGIATNGNTTTNVTGCLVNFIDGVQSLGPTVVLSCQSVAAPVTYNGTANQAFYASVNGVNQIKVGDSVTIAGFATSANNVTATVNYVTSSGIYVTNSSAVAETNPAATIKDVQAAVPVLVDIFLTGNASDTAAVVSAAAATPGIYASAVSSTGFTLNWSALATTAQTFHFGAIIAFSS